MLRRILRRSAPFALLVPATFLSLFGGCGGRDVILADADEASAPVFAAPDAAEASIPEELISYCPSTKCPAGHTTCADSYFRCDVDLMTDRYNCGACGVQCHGDTNSEFYSCVEGQCVMTCMMNSGSGRNLDCDGVPDNGCETKGTNNNENCGGCGVACLDPDKPCINEQCGCPSGLTRCELQPGVNTCLPTHTDDDNCGACLNACDRSGAGAPHPPNTYFGCRQSTCGKIKCNPGWVDCDDDLFTADGLPNLEGNGCETESGTDANCAACGDDCLAKGQTCLRKPRPESTAFCGCPEGQTFCGKCESEGTIIVHADGGDVTIPLPAVCVGRCIDLRTDPDNCGACGLKCPGTPTTARQCEFGTCVQHCPLGRADCDGNPGCEVNTLSDPHNCGGCGITCDAIAGQACVGGQCMVEPCDPADGGLLQ